MKETQPGFWPSTITPDMAAGHTIHYSQIKVFDSKVYWLEQRPNEKGRSVVVCFDGKKTIDVTPKETNVHSRVHEYGGGDYAVGKTGVYYVNKMDQCLYRTQGQQTVRLTEPTQDQSVRYADLFLSEDEHYLLCVRETHLAQDVVNDLVLFSEGEVVGQMGGADFYMFPSISSDGKKIAWIQWNLPNMPWDESELWCADWVDGQFQSPRKVVGEKAESIYQPSFNEKNQLFYISDETGWWNLYSNHINVLPIKAECGYPAWIFGTKTYAFIEENTLAAILTENGVQRLCLLEDQSITSLETPYDHIDPFIAADQNAIYCIAGNAASAPVPVKYDIKTKTITPLVDANKPNANWISTPKALTFKTTEDQKAYAFYYAPKNPNFALSEDEKPPLMVVGHGGPTGATTTALNYKIQFWTSRGFAVIDVNYRGSTGYGRSYRELLKKNWGKFDVEDCISAAQYCIKEGFCDPEHVFIRGKSASGLTALLCLEKTNLFCGGAIYYGVADLTALLNDTHKFESGYTDLLVGPYPESKALFAERSPLQHIDQLKTPLIVFQGGADRVVPKAHSDQIVAALKVKGIACEYVIFDDEGHGFRNGKNISTALSKELSFYQSLL